jgi:hypothetical protein
MLRRLFLAAVTTALAAIALFGSTGTAGAETREAAPRSAAEVNALLLIHNFNALCVDIGSNAPGTVVGMTYCNANLLSQQWYFNADNTIVNRNNGLCMDIGANAPGVTVGITNCHPGYTSQKWYTPGDHTIRNFNGLCMDLGANAPGVPVVLAYCRPGYTSQMWYFF